MEEQNNSKVIGKVAALESQPSTIDEFYFWTKKDTLLNPFDVVVVNWLFCGSGQNLDVRLDPA